MSIEKLAKHVQRHGRGEDTMLVHMTPNEVRGLQALARRHGGSLTINPKTGLPEAGFLSKILPMIAGIGLSFIPGVGPWAAAGLTAAGTTIATGSLKKGLLAGLGAYGGAGLAAGAASLGANAVSGAASVGGTAAANAARLGAAETAASASLPSAQALSASTQAGTGALRTAASLPGAASGVTSAVPQAMAQQAAPMANAVQPTLAQQTQTGLQNLGTGFMNNAQNAGRGVQAAFSRPMDLVNSTGGPMQTAIYTGAAAAPFFETPEMKMKKLEGDGEDRPNISLSQDFYSRPMYSGEPDPLNYRRSFSAGGITSLGAYANGGRVIEGPGDGMSDSVPASLEGRRPAALSDGEFVIAADVVSGLGNGSSRAGAARLYSFMDRVRRARTGTEKQGKQIDADRMMPA